MRTIGQKFPELHAAKGKRCERLSDQVINSFDTSTQKIRNHIDHDLRSKLLPTQCEGIAKAHVVFCERSLEYEI